MVMRTLECASPDYSTTSSFRDAPAELGFTRVRHYNCPSRQQPTWMRRPGIQNRAHLWIPGSRQRVRAKRGPMTGSGARPGMTRPGRLTSAGAPRVMGVNKNQQTQYTVFQGG